MTIFKEKELNLRTTISYLIIIGLISGVLGFIYETIFYRIDLGYFVKRGSTFGPWIPIYFFGGILITLFTYRFKDKPLAVFLINCVVTGILEFGTGYVLYEFFKIRLWDYNTEIWNFGNIGGYICFRSILFFGLSSLFLIYGIIPTIFKVREKISQKGFDIISYIGLAIFVCDMILHAILSKGLN